MPPITCVHCNASDDSVAWCGSMGCTFRWREHTGIRPCFCQRLCCWSYCNSQAAGSQQQLQVLRVSFRLKLLMDAHFPSTQPNMDPSRRSSDLKTQLMESSSRAKEITFTGGEFLGTPTREATRLVYKILFIFSHREVDTSICTSNVQCKSALHTYISFRETDSYIYICMSVVESFQAIFEFFFSPIFQYFFGL